VSVRQLVTKDTDASVSTLDPLGHYDALTLGVAVAARGEATGVPSIMTSARLCRDSPTGLPQRRHSGELHREHGMTAVAGSTVPSPSVHLIEKSAAKPRRRSSRYLGARPSAHLYGATLTTGTVTALPRLSLTVTFSGMGPVSDEI
jgi:hypothetical protein